MQQMREVDAHKKLDKRRDICFNAREILALDEENVGIIWKRMHSVSARAFEALLQSMRI